MKDLKKLEVLLRKLITEVGLRILSKPCEKCDGRGTWQDGGDCAECDGAGEIFQFAELP